MYTFNRTGKSKQSYNRQKPRSKKGKESVGSLLKHRDFSKKGKKGYRNTQHLKTAENFRKPKDNYIPQSPSNSMNKKTLSPLIVKKGIHFKNSSLKPGKNRQDNLSNLTTHYNIKNSFILEEEKEMERERLSHDKDDMDLHLEYKILVKQYQSLEMENGRLKKQLKSKNQNQAIKDIKESSQQQMYHKENQQLRQEIQKYKTEVKFLKKRNMTLQSENLKLKEKKGSDKLQEVSNLDKEISEMKSEALVLQMQLENLRTVYQQQQAQIEYQNQQMQYMSQHSSNRTHSTIHPDMGGFNPGDFMAESFVPAQLQAPQNQGGINPDNMSYEELLNLQEQMGGNVNTGLSQKELRMIPELAYGKQTKIEKDDKCSICFNGYKFGSKVKKLQCGHYYHVKCISQWLKQKKKCPICNEEVVVKQKKLGRRRKR